MKAFDVTIQFEARVQRLAVIANTSVEAMLRAFDLVEEGEQFSVAVREMKA